MKKRYQECSFIVRLYRRLKYQPFYFILALFYTLKAIYQRILKKGYENPKLVFRLLSSEWQRKAQWYYTHEEVFNNLLKKVQVKQ